MSHLVKPLLIFLTLYGFIDGLHFLGKCVERLKSVTEEENYDSYSRVTKKSRQSFDERWSVILHIACMTYLRQKVEKQLQTKTLGLKKKIISRKEQLDSFEKYKW